MVIFNRTKHQALWNWLADNPDKKKDEWPEWSRYGGTIEEVDCLCFACQYARDCLIENGRLFANKCRVYCPLNIGDNSNITCLNGMYDEWQFEEDFSRRSELAREIANLPVRTYVDYYI